MSQQYLYSQQKNELHQLQLDVVQVQSLFNKWKQCLLCLPSANESQKIQIGQQILVKLNNIFQTVGQFCFKFERQMIKLQNKLQSIILRSNTVVEVDNKIQHSQFAMIIKKVQSLQKQLMETKQRGNKLQEALNALMSRPSLQQTAKNQRKLIKHSNQLNMAYGEQSFIYNLPLHCSSKSSNTKCGVQKRQNRYEQSNIYLSSANSRNFDSSMRSNPFIVQREDRSQFIRTLSIENQQKYSLKHIPVLSRQINFNQTTKRSDSLVFRKNSSKDKHEHRLDFMMKNLGQ